jgi:abequosyltransferase
VTEPGQKLISFCIPTYNRAQYLRETLACILPQLGPDVEVVISDNASTDGTPEVVDKFQRRFSEIRYFSNGANLGFDRNLLNCLEHASGEYVWFFGSDDLLDGDGVETVRHRILQSPKRPALVYLNHQVVDNEGHLLIPDQIGCQRDQEFSSAAKCVEWLGSNLGYMSALVLRRDLCLPFARTGAFVGSGWIHLHLVLSCLLVDGSVQYIGSSLVRARRSISPDYDLTKCFVEQADRVFWDARRSGYPWLTIYRARNRTVREQYLRFVLAWRCDAPDQLVRSFPVLLRTCWMYPWFWLLLVPLRFLPRWLAVWLRAKGQTLRARRCKNWQLQTVSPPSRWK